MKESRYQRTLMKELVSLGCFVQKLHGNVYQAGLPDLLIHAPNAELGLIEMKGTSKILPASIPFTDIFDKLQGVQKGTMILLAKRKAKIGIILGTPKGYFCALTPFQPKMFIVQRTVQDAAKEVLNWLSPQP